MSTVESLKQTSELPALQQRVFSIQMADHLANFPVIDIDRIEGEQDKNHIIHPINFGNEHWVFRYLLHPVGDPRNKDADHYLLKIPRIGDRELVKTWDTTPELYSYYVKVKEHFGDVIPESFFVADVTSPEKGYCIIQREIPHATTLTLDHLLKNANLRKQFYEIIDKNNELFHKTGYYLPLLGLDGAKSIIERRTPELSNIVIEGQGDDAQLCIVDFGLLNSNPEVHKEKHSRHHALVSGIQHVRQQGLRELEKLDEFLSDQVMPHIEAFRDRLSIAGNDLAIELFFLYQLNKHLHAMETNHHGVN